MNTVKHDQQVLVLLLAGATLSLFLFYLRGFKPGNYVVSPFVPTAPSSTPTPTIDPATQMRETSLDSPDGAKTLTMKYKKEQSMMTYSFYTSTKVDPTQKLLLTKTSDLANIISLPFNSWSSDYRYVFIKETTPKQTNFYVFSSLGSSTANTEQDTNVTDLFVKKYPTDVLEDVTGWASPTLLVVNAKQGDQEISYWFDVPSQSFIRLSNRFN